MEYWSTTRSASIPRPAGLTAEIEAALRERAGIDPAMIAAELGGPFFGARGPVALRKIRSFQRYLGLREMVISGTRHAINMRGHNNKIKRGKTLSAKTFP